MEDESELGSWVWHAHRQVLRDPRSEEPTLGGMLLGDHLDFSQGAPYQRGPGLRSPAGSALTTERLREGFVPAIGLLPPSPRPALKFVPSPDSRHQGTWFLRS